MRSAAGIAGAEAQLARDPRMPAGERVDVQAGDRVGVALGDLLDVDAAARREHEERPLGAAVERDREVVLALDVGGALDPERAHDVAADVEPEDLGRALGGLLAASLPA